MNFIQNIPTWDNMLFDETEEEIVKNEGAIGGSIVFDEDKYVSDDEDHMLSEEIEDMNQNDTHVEPYYNEKTNFKDV